MTDALKTIDLGDKEIHIKRDEHPENPRMWGGTVGTMAAFHGRYDLGDGVPFHTDDFSGWAEMRSHIEEEHDVVAILPLYLLDHSHLHMMTSPHRNKWDSGQVGYIYATQDDVERLGLEDRDPEEIEEMLQDEVETYDQYLRGDVYGYILYEKETCDKGHVHKEQVDSCWGFYTMDPSDMSMYEHIKPHLTETEQQEVKA